MAPAFAGVIFLKINVLTILVYHNILGVLVEIVHLVYELIFGGLDNVAGRRCYMFKVDVMSGQPIYEQIINQVEQFILIGVLKPDDKIPSVRSMAEKILVNPNTIQKAYTELDHKGIIYSVPGRGCFVSKEAVNILNMNNREKLSELENLIFELAIAGVDKKEVEECVIKAFEKKEKL